MSEVGTQDISCRNQTAPDCLPNFSLDMTYWGKMVNEKAKEGMEYHLPKSCDNCRAYDRTHRSASLMTGQDESPDAPDADISNHENDGANDDYECYGDYDISMSQAGMVTSIDDVEEVNWWNQQPAVQTDMHAQVDMDSETADSFAIPSTDGRGETLEELNSPCPWITTADNEDACSGRMLS